MTPKSFHFPSLKTDQMIEVDRLMEEKYHIKLILMMENARRNLADQAPPKQGLLETDAREYVGELHLVDISGPPELYADAFGIHVPIPFL